jgi:hypothetical protein
MRTGPVREAQQKKKCVYIIPCDCAICYIGETSRHLDVCVKEHKYNLKICWNEVTVLQIGEPNTTYRKYKDLAHLSLLNHPISQLSLEISRTWTPIITAEVKELQLRQV